MGTTSNPDPSATPPGHPAADVGGPWPDDVIGLLQALIAIPSINPEGQTDTTITGEQRIADYVSAYLRHLGATVTQDEVLPRRPNVIGRFPSATAGKPRVLLAPHLDTVGIDGMTIDPFGGQLRDGRIHGRGASDTKGSMAAMLWALTELRHDLANLAVEVHFAGLMAEETGQAGSRHFARQHGADYAFAIAGEPTGRMVVHTHKGSNWCGLILRGLAAHGATPERGHNAIVDMARAIEWLDGPFRRRLAEVVPPDPVLGVSTINIGTCRGGFRTNVVPDHAEVWLDLRSIPALDSRGGPVELLRHELAAAGIAAEVRLGANEGRSLATDPRHPLVQQLAAAGTGIGGAPWFCDAANLAAVGVPAVAAGPGSIAQAHTADEWIAVDELQAGVDFFRRFLENARME